MFLNLFGQQILKLIDKKVYQARMCLTDDKGFAVFLADRNLSCPIFILRVIPSVVETVLHRICQNILNTLFGKLFKNRFNCNSRGKSVISIVLADRLLNRICTGNVGIIRGAVSIQLTGFIGVVCCLTIDRDIQI